METAVIIGMANTDTKKANDAADAAKGKAIASLLIKEIEAQAGKLKKFLVNLMELSQAGRTAFRTSVKEHMTALRAAQPDKESHPAEHEMYGKMLNSVGVRLSEAVSFSKAVDKGYMPDLESANYHALIVEARMVNASDVSAGPAEKRGRKAKDTLEKLQSYLLKIPADERAAARDLVTKLFADY